MSPGTLWITGESEVDDLVNTDPLALLIGMLLDQQIAIELAFRGPSRLKARLGNTLDAPFEGNWAPAAKESFFQQYRSKNFTNVRIPVQWGHHFVESDENFTVESDFMDRVEQVVDWSLTYGFVTIVNVHHDEWFESGYPSP